MCLTIKERFITREQAREFCKNPLIAKKDIPVYKKLYFGSSLSIYQDFKYEKGFHYYQDGKEFSFKLSCFGRWRVDVHQGLHSYTNEQRANQTMFGNWTVKMFIPKGAKYFIGNDNDFVSNELVWY